MRKWILVVLSIAYCPTVEAQVAVGLRDNRYGFISYTHQEHWLLKLEHSIYAEKFSFQKIRLAIGYQHRHDNFIWGVSPYFSTLYNVDYQDFGTFINGEYQPIKGIALKGVVNPHYDSGYDYTTCFQAGVSVYLYKGMGAEMHYSTITEYRISEKRIRVGLTFSEGNLLVSPLISVPAEGNVKSIRVLCGCSYTF